MVNILRNIPKIDTIIENQEIKNRIDKHGREFILGIIRKELDKLREKIKTEEINKIDQDEIINEIIKKLDLASTYNFSKVVNGTGVILHTNLGRSIFSQEISKNICDYLTSYTNLEYNLKTGHRGHRYDHIIDIIKEVTKAEDALVVNNNAAAVLLTLKTLAHGKEVIVSRGELVEIGGSFRIPEVIKESACILKEVGTTNKTHLQDYKNAINENTGAIIKIHTSNYKIVGFTQDVKTEELKEITIEKDIPLIEDLGSGMLLDLNQFGLHKEPTVKETLEKGVDIVTFSGDKLLGGPQAGIIVGKKKYIEKIKNNQLLRALRVDKFTIMSLEFILRRYLDIDSLGKYVPTIRMITEDTEDVKKRAEKLYITLEKLQNKNFAFEIIKCNSMIGGGSYPLDTIKSYGIKIIAQGFSENKLEEYLRYSETPIITRIVDDSLIIDCKTILEKDYELIYNAFTKLGDNHD